MIKLFEIPDLVESKFISRPNRFIANILYEGKETTAHVHDPGRLKELLTPNARLLMKKGTGKLPWYIQAVNKNKEWILLDSSLQSKIFKKLFYIMDDFQYVKEIRAEVPLGKSRIDFMLDDIPLENKGVSLVVNDIALFPDAPTKRGTRHVGEIIKHNGILFFIIFRSAKSFSPNFAMDPEFSSKVKEAREKGIKIICAQVFFDGRFVYYKNKIPLEDF